MLSFGLLGERFLTLKRRRKSIETMHYIMMLDDIEA